MFGKLVLPFLLSIGILVFNGCLPKKTSEVMNSWMGSHISKVIRSWGPLKMLRRTAPEVVFTFGESKKGNRLLDDKPKEQKQKVNSVTIL